jgi:hypothetical protein
MAERANSRGDQLRANMRDWRRKSFTEKTKL